MKRALLPLLLIMPIFAGCPSDEDQNDAGVAQDANVSLPDVRGSDVVESSPDVRINNPDVDLQVDAGSSEADAGSGPVSPLCLFGGSGTQSVGAECGCAEDCEGPSPFCGRDPDNLFGPSFCTSTCEDGGDCAGGFYCFDNFAPVLDGFCAACGDDDSVELGEACRCDSECQNFDGQSADCLSEECTLTECFPFLPGQCPESFNCELSIVDLTTTCVECVQPSPAEEFAQCNCELDCGSGLRCIDEQCRRECDNDGECAEDQECTSAALGESLCAPIPDNCDATLEKGIGDTCACNAECGAEAPSCVTIQFGLNVCTVRGCDPFSNTDQCPVPEGGMPGDWVCCGAALTFEPTCVPGFAAAQLSSFAQCSEVP